MARVLTLALGGLMLALGLVCTAVVATSLLDAEQKVALIPGTGLIALAGLLLLVTWLPRGRN